MISQRRTLTSRQLRLAKRWQELCDRFLPFAPTDSIWRFSRRAVAADPPQGWKLHISATILTATKTLEKIGPFLTGRNVLFKAPRNLEELTRINCGLFYGFSQVGKFITIYPQSENEAISVAEKLHELTSRFLGPAVPFDRPFQNSRCVFYRYGAFAELKIDRNGNNVPAVRNSRGRLVEDRRAPDTAVPDWLVDPFPPSRRRGDSRLSPLRTTIRAFDALSQRGKGGVYRALDLSVSPARLCVLKEGRKHGETEWDGRDGAWRVNHEATVLTSLSAAGIRVPAVFLTFKSGMHSYLVTEFIEGESLQSISSSKKPKLSIEELLELCRGATNIINQIHLAGWVWRDCKPLNLIRTKNNEVRPIDFEGACPVDCADPTPWGTEGYIAPEFRLVPQNGARAAEDLYALGATLQQLLTEPKARKNPDRTDHNRKLKVGVPKAVGELILALLAQDPCARPSAQSALRVFEEKR